MLFTVLIVFFSLIFLIILHELGHFWVAKKFGVKVEEFGIFLPPRLFGKKFGETIYSINLIPFGAFVRLLGEEGKERTSKDARSFSNKPIWQRVLIVVGGVVAFWVVAAVLFSIIVGIGIPVAVSDSDNGALINPKIQIAQVAADSPAEAAGLRIGDAIKEFKISNSKFPIKKVSELQKLTEQQKGKEVVLTIERGKEVFDVSLVPRPNPPNNQGPLGLVLLRTAEKSYPWYEAPFRGIEATVKATLAIISALAGLVVNLVTGKGLPAGAQVMGPVGIGALLVNFAQLGLVQYLHIIAIISIYLAIFNILPIPALDGGKLLFLGLEKIKGRPINYRLEQNITVFFFVVLLFFIILVTFRDIARLF